MSVGPIRVVIAARTKSARARIRSLITRSAPPGSFRLTNAASAAELRRHAARGSADVVVLDERFSPAGSGALLESLHAGPVSSAVPVILLVSGRARVSARDGAGPPGAAATLAIETLSGAPLVRALRKAATGKAAGKARVSRSRRQARLREIVSNAGVFLCSHDLKGRLLSIDAIAARALGYSPARLVGISIAKLLDPAQRARFPEYLERIRRDGVAAGEMAVRTRDGEIRLWSYQNRLVNGIVHGSAVDATERIRAGDDSAVQFELRGAILDALPARIALLGRDGTVLAVNEAWRKFGRARGAPHSAAEEGDRYFDAGAWMGATPGVVAAIREVLDGTRRSYDADLSLDGAEGEEWLRLLVAPIRLGRHRGAIVMHVDRTAQRKAEEAQRQNALIFENMHDAVVVADPSGAIRDWNASAAAMYGLKRGQSEGQGVKSLMADATDARDAPAILAEVEERGRWSGEIGYRQPDGSRGIRELVVVGLRDASGALLGSAGISRDITARREAEERLCLSEERYRALFEGSLAGIYRTSRDGKILSCNDAFARILGYEPGELRRLRAQDLYFSAEDRETGMESLSRNGALRASECRLKRRDGSPVWVLENVSLVPGSDGPEIEGSMIDITDRHLVEDALRDSEERYRNLFDRNPLPMWVYDVESLRIVDVNDAAVRHYGYSRADFAAMSLPDLRPEAERANFRAKVAPEARVPQPFFPSRHLRRDGTVIHVEVSAVDLPGASRHRMALARDVTDRVRAEALLRASEEQYRTIVEEAPIGISRTKPDGRWVSVNRSFARMLGYASPEELLATGRAQEIHPDPNVRRTMVETILRDGSLEREVELRRKDGSAVYVQASIHSTPPDGAGERCLEAFVIDVTRQRIAERQQGLLQSAVFRSAREWRETFDAIEEVIWILDERSEVRRLNRAAARLSGRSIAECIGLPIAAAAPGEPATGAAELVSSRGGDREAIRRSAEDGRTWVISAVPIGTDETAGSGHIVIARDVSAVVDLQESLLRSQSMSAMGTLVAGVAHEVRNPLFAISATLDAFELRFGGEPAYRKYAAALRAQIERMTTLMRDLLDFARPAVFERAPVAAGEILAEAARLCADRGASRSVRLDCRGGDGLPRVDVDRSRTVQVFVNLIDNAIQHSPAGGIVRVGGAAGGAGVTCAVDDDGPGFAPDDLARAFEPFFTRRPGGTGMGLAIVRRIVTEQGGQVTLGNRPGGGARVEVTLPVAGEQQQSEETA